MNEYLSLANFILPEGMLDWFNLKDVRTTSANGQTTIHIYLDKNEKTPDGRTDLRPNGFTRESTFHDFPIRGQEVLLHVRLHRWLDTDGHNVMTECDFVQETTRCSKELAAFLKDALETHPITVRSFEKDYFIDGDAFERAYKLSISGFSDWSEALHAEEWLVFPENVAIVKDTKAQAVIKALKRISEDLRSKVEEVTLDFSESMHSIVTACFPKAMLTLDRFHHQQFCLEAVQEVRVSLRREEMTRMANEREEHRLMLKTFAGDPSQDLIYHL